MEHFHPHQSGSKRSKLPHSKERSGNYFFNCAGGSFTPGLQSPTGSCTFVTPRAYWIALMV